MANESTATERKDASSSAGERESNAGRNSGNGLSFSRLLLLGVAAGAGTCC